ncbi:KAT8 regulatory NSL complex subunit 1 [Agrilus planipennis]|uniref:KAT8 regulatory NSL complex subunit 1 n=1 Tax=Agrilus planipennis TaxID=224129 RepID=A0A1W4WJX7_AGRPL|nr:KAT8 regulatory NSL complex subunit 1 [Agrilus planipennis]
MGVRTASARHLHVLVMAPALTDSEQSQKFSLSPKTLKTTDFGDCISQSVKKNTKGDDHQLGLDTDDNHLIKNAPKNISLSAVRGSGDEQLGQLQQHSPKHNSSIGVMNNKIRMDDPQDKMGLEKTRIDNISSLVKDKSIPNDVEQILNNFEPDLCENDAETVGDIPPPNVDEIMQVIKSMEATNTADSMFSLATDLTTNLSPFEKELLNDVDVMNMSMDDQLLDGAATLKEHQTKEVIAELQKRQLKIERRVDFLLRRLRKIQVKHMGQHVSNEIAGVFEHANRTLRKAKEAANNNTTAQNKDQEPPPPYHPSSLQEASGSPEPLATIVPSTTTNSKDEKLKPISQSSAKSLVRKLETSTLFQATIVARQKFTPRYFGSGSVEPASYRSGYQNMTTLPPWSAEHKAELQKVAGSLHTQLRIVQQAVDSEATASSSGGESCDEFQTYGNPHQQYLSIQKRAAWRYSTDRAAIASRWTWLQAQIADLEYRIRQYADLQKLVRANKGPVLLEGEHEVPSSPSAVNGYRGQLPGASPLVYFNNKNVMSEVGGVGGLDATGSPNTASSTDCCCARSRPLRCGFRKRKLVQIAGLHAVSKKAARPSTIRCGCAPASGIPPCAVCTGRTDPTHPKDLTDCLNTQERIALIDPAFHPVISFSEDVSSSIHLEAIMKTSDWQMKSTKSNFKTMKFNMKTDRRNKTSPNVEEDLTKKVDHRRKYNRLMKTKMKKMRGRKPMLHSSLTRLKKKRHNVRLAMAQLQAMSAEGADEETEALSNSAAAAAAAAAGGNGPRSMSVGNIVVDSPCSSPLLTMQAISGYSSKQRNSRVSSYDIDNIVIPYSVAASTRVEKLQYKEILTPKWRLVDPDFAVKYTKTNGVVRDPESDVEDLSEEALLARHEKSEHEEKKKFLSYLKFPVGSGRSRSHKRTDSRAESSGGNTPDPLSPHPIDHTNTTVSASDIVTNSISGSSPVLSPPATPLPSIDECPLPSVSVMRRRTISQSTRGKDRGIIEEEDEQREVIEMTVTPYDRRTFPLAEDAYDKMLKQMPEDHRQCSTNSRSQDVQRRRSSSCFSPLNDDEDDRRDSLTLGSPMVVCAAEGDDDSESTESAYGDEDPNDPEWSDFECVRDRYGKR